MLAYHALLLATVLLLCVQSSFALKNPSCTKTKSAKTSTTLDFGVGGAGKKENVNNQHLPDVTKARLNKSYETTAPDHGRSLAHPSSSTQLTL